MAWNPCSRAPLLGVAFAALAAGAGLTVATAGPQPGTPAPGALSLAPAAAIIDGSYGFQTLAVVVTAPDGGALDVTSSAKISSANPRVVRIQNGTALPVGDGQADVVAVFGGRTARARITVRNSRTDASLSFQNDITPILLKAGCNGAACHGAPQGQGGLKLSYFGYEPDKDRDALWTGDSGRRVNPRDPGNSLAVLKPLNVVPHKGGRRFASASAEHRALVAWIRAGGPLHPRARQAADGARLASLSSVPAAGSPRLESLEVWPAARTVRTPNSRHRLLVTARYSDGSAKDVTPLCRFTSDDDGIASVAANGEVLALRHGEANVMVRYNGKAGVSSFLMLVRPAPTTYPRLPENNLIDTHVFGKLRRMGIVPSEPASDAQFLRRASLDIAGVLPTPNAIREFVASKDPRKREKLVDELLERPEYQDVMTIMWSDLLRVSRTFLQEPGVRAYTAWIRDAFAENRPFDEFVRELLSSGSHTREQVEGSRDSDDRARMAVYRQSSGYHTGPVNYYRVTSDPVELATSTSQIFLGVRLDCTRCHNHPFDRWTMDDFYGFAAYFAGTGQTGGKVRDEVAIFTDPSAAIANPRSGRVCRPKPLTASQEGEDPGLDRKKALARWITSRDNPFFARATVNRFWKHFFGRGIVHPVDDFRATNPPVNAPLLDALARDFADHGWDVKRLIRLICTSRVYQLSDRPNATNAGDTKNFSRFYSRRLGPEVLHDAIVAATGVPETFGGAVARRATNLPDNSVPSYFLDVFGRSRRLQVQERSDQTSMSQALHLMNGGTINERIAHAQGRVAQILKKQFTQEDAVEEIFLATLSRPPSARERRSALVHVAESPSPKEGYEDLLWAIINSREFVFNH